MQKNSAYEFGDGRLITVSICELQLGATSAVLLEKLQTYVQDLLLAKELQGTCILSYGIGPEAGLLTVHAYFANRDGFSYLLEKDPYGHLAEIRSTLKEHITTYVVEE